MTKTKPESSYFGINHCLFWGDYSPSYIIIFSHDDEELTEHCRSLMVLLIPLPGYHEKTQLIETGNWSANKYILSLLTMTNKIS
jgi:hypothetical protein